MLELLLSSGMGSKNKPPPKPVYLTSNPAEPLRAGGSTAVIGDLIYMLNGVKAVNGTQARAFSRYNILTGAWSQLATPPMADNAYAPLLVYNGLLYYYNYYSGIVVYNPAANTWGTVITIPSVYRRYYDSYGAIANKFYFVGGTPTNGLTWSYDPGTNTWETKLTCPVNAYVSSGAVWDGDLYIWGGALMPEGAPPNGDGFIYRYRPADNTWTKLVYVKPSCNFSMVFAHNGKIYIAGGITALTPQSYKDEVHQYDIATGGVKLFATLPKPMDSSMVVVAKNKAFFYGGKNATAVFSDFFTLDLP